MKNIISGRCCIWCSNFLLKVSPLIKLTEKRYKDKTNKNDIKYMGV